MATEETGGRCDWCGRPLRGARLRFCSAACRDIWVVNGGGPSLAQVEARRAHVEAQPKGCVSVAEFIAKGGVIYRER